MTTSNRPLASEGVYGEKWDRCLKDTAVKIGELEFLIYLNCNFDYYSFWSRIGHRVLCCTLQT